MKILHVETGRHFYGGAQQVVWLSEGLRRSGVDNLLVCPPGAAIDAVARAAGVRVVNIPCAGDLDLRFVWRLRQCLVGEDPAIVHCHSRRGADFLGGQSAAMAGIPAVVSRRVDNPEPGLVAGLRYRPFRRIVAISENVAGVLGDAGVEPARITVIRDAVDTDRFRDRPDRALLGERLGIAADEFAIAVVAQLIERKGQRYILDAVAGLRSRYPQIRLVIFGCGPMEDELRAHAARLNLGDRVRFAGFRADLDDYLGCFDLLVHPAVREGLGVAMLKAAAAGLPVVAFDAAGAREAVVHDETGVLVPMTDVGALQDAIAGMIDNPQRRRTFGAAGSERMRREFSLDRMVDEHVKMYESIRQ